MSSPERERGRWPSTPHFVPRSLSDLGGDDIPQQEHGIILPSSVSHSINAPSEEMAEEHSFPRTGARATTTLARKRLPLYSMPSPEFGEDPRGSTPQLFPTSSSKFAGQYQAARLVGIPKTSNMSGEREIFESTPLVKRSKEDSISRMVTETATSSTSESLPVDSISSPDFDEDPRVSTSQLLPASSSEFPGQYQATQLIATPKLGPKMSNMSSLEGTREHTKSTQLAERSEEHSLSRMVTETTASSTFESPSVDNIFPPEFGEDPRGSTPQLVPTSSSEFSGQYQATQLVVTPRTSNLSSLEVARERSQNTLLVERPEKHSRLRIITEIAASSTSEFSPEFGEYPRGSTPQLVSTSSSEFAGQYQAAQLVSPPKMSSMSSFEEARERSATPLAERPEEHLFSRTVTETSASSTSENLSVDSISSVEVRGVQWASTPHLDSTSSLELAREYEPSQPAASLISISIPSLEREEECIPRSVAGNLQADNISFSKVGGERWTFTPQLAPPLTLEFAGPYKDTQSIARPRSSRMSSLEIARERILSRAGSATTSSSTNRILSKVNTGGRIRLDKGEGSVRFLQDLAQNVGKVLGRNIPEKQAESREESIDKSKKFYVDTSNNIPLVPLVMPVSPPRWVVSRENERPFQTHKEVQKNSQSSDGMKNIMREVWISFANWNNRRTLKKIKASLQVLRTYHDAILHGEVPLNLQIKSRLRAGWIGFIWHVVEFLLGAISAALYVYSTYHKGTNYKWLADVQESISVAFLADYLFRLYTESSRFYYIFSFWGAMDFLSMIPMILIFSDNIAGVSFIKLLHFLRIVRIFALINKSHMGRSVNQQIILLSVGTFGVIILDAGIIHWIEYYTATEARQKLCPERNCLSFWQSFYFIIVTVGTVGFGDFSAKTGLGQFAVCVTIITALIVIPIRVGQITHLAFLRPYGGSVSARKLVGSRFLILSGGISLLAVQNFLVEFYKQTHRQEFEAYPLRVVIMGSHRPSFDLKQVLNLYQGKAEFIEGSPLHPEDLERITAHKAMAILLVAYQETKDTSSEDAAQIMRALAVHRFCRTHGSEDHPIRIIVEVLNPATQRSAVWDEKYSDSIEVICPTKIHYKLMARSCFVKGLYTLVTNLFTSELRRKYLDERDFQSEYFNSFDNEIYPVILPPAFYSIPFEEVAEIILDMFNSILFALDTPVSSSSVHGKKKHKVLLFPRGHLIGPDDVGLIITNDLRIAHEISRFELREQDSNDAVSDAVKLWNRFMGSSQSGERRMEEIGLLRHVGRSLDKPDTFFTRASMRRDISFGIRGNIVYPEDQDSEFGLETQFREAIQEVYTHQEYPEWRSKPTADVEHFSPLDGKVSHEVSCGDEEFRFPEGVSLEKAAEKLLGWPPMRLSAPPHPAVLERREKEILDNLKDRTLSLVAFNIPHIIVCCQLGWPTNFFYFLTELRNPKSVNPPVVILYPKEPTHFQWGSVGMFDNVFYVKGSPKYELDLMRSGVIQAARIIVLANQGQPVDLGGSGVVDDKFANGSAAAYTSDIENIVVTANVQRLCGDKVMDKIIVEMQHANAFHYLQPHYKVPFSQFKWNDLRWNGESLIHFGPPYMEGKATSLAMLGFLMRATFFNRNTISIVEQLIMGGFAITEDGLSPDRQRILKHMEIPPECANKTFQNLLTYLLHERNMLAIGLYRVRGNLGAPTSYVLTNPRKDCIVNLDDLVYVLT